MRYGRGRLQLAIVLLVLVLLHSGLRPLLGEGRAVPDFLLLALLVYAIDARPGNAAVAGFLVGLLADSLSPIAFGAGIFAYTVIGYLAAWGKTVRMRTCGPVTALFDLRSVMTVTRTRPLSASSRTLSSSGETRTRPLVWRPPPLQTTR